uniref:Uncharacterized protein n=1 Tax=Anguilla anguilla TaxID=7936 RepID=A0A0E9V9T5_ANGAN
MNNKPRRAVIYNQKKYKKALPNVCFSETPSN